MADSPRSNFPGVLYRELKDYHSSVDRVSTFNRGVGGLSPPDSPNK